ncbi:APC family permease [Aeromicrobium sp. P5_D10]
MSTDLSTAEVSRKGLARGAVGIVGAVAIGVSCIAPAYTLTGTLGPTVDAVGKHLPAIFIVGFIPMLLVALGYRELNTRMQDSGTSFTWVTRAFGPWVGWLAGWGLIAATVLVLSNLAGIAVDFFYLALSQIFSSSQVADLTRNPIINVITCLVFIAGATFIAYRDMTTTQRFQYVLVAFQIVVLVLFAAVAIVLVAQGDGFGTNPVTWDSFNPFSISSFSALAAGLSLSIFIFWGWDVTLTMSEEMGGSSRAAGNAATITIAVIMGIYMLLAVSLMAFAGIGDEGAGLGNPDIQENAFFALAGPVLGSFAILVSLAVLASSAASLQSTFVSPARTMLAMGHYGALPQKFARIHPRFKTPSYSTLVSAVVTGAFYAVMRLLSEDVLWDTITAIGMLICFYYGLTALACVWYFRNEWFDDVRSFCLKFLAPLLGGLVLSVLFFVTLIDSADPEYGSGSHVAGVGLVFLLGVVVLGLGVVIMLAQARQRPEFFRGVIIRRGVAGDADEKTVSLDG